MKHLFIVNPVAGGKDRREYVAEQARRALEGSEDAYEVYVTTAPMDACAKIAAEAASGEELRVYACGGDGTLNECVNGAVGHANVAVTHFPCGTGNDFIKMFGEEKARFFDLAELVRGEVRQIRHSEYILASRCMGGSFSWIMRRHLVPNVVSAILFVVISAVSTSIAMESTLSFLGLGLPVDELSWGSMLALADKALLLNTWWVILIPGLFLVTALLCITSLGHHFRRNSVRGPSNL